jgi:hypothetical protein
MVVVVNHLLEPKTHDTNVTSKVLQEWLRVKRTFVDSDVMPVTNATNYHEVYFMDLGAAKIFVDYAREYKSSKMDSLPFRQADSIIR